MIPLHKSLSRALFTVCSVRKSARLRDAVRRAATARLRFGMASRALLVTGALLLGSRAASYGQGAVTGDTQYNYQNSTGLFSTGFTPTFTTDVNGQLNFGGTAAYTATDDLTAANVNDLTFTDTLLVTVASSTASNVLTLTNNSLGIAPSIYVGSGGATIGTILAGTNGFAKNGTGNLTLQTNADTYTGNVIINGGTLTLNIGQSSTAAFYLNNGVTLAGNQGLSASNFVYANSGTSTFTTAASGVTNAFFAGNGIINFGIAGTASPGESDNFLQNFGGTLAFTASQSISLNRGTNAITESYDFATINLGSGTASLNNKTGSFTTILGGLASSGNASISAGAAGGHSNTYVVGSANASTTFAGTIVNSAASGTEFIKVGTGTLTLTGVDNAVNTYSGSGANGFSNSVSGGTLLLDDSGHTTAILAAASTLEFSQSGTLSIKGNATTATTETVAATTVNVGGGSIVVVPNGGTTTLNLGTLTATAAGGALNIQPPTATIGTGTAVITTSTAKGADGTYGGRITFGTDWATTTSTSAPYTLSAYTAYTPLVASGSSATTDYYLNTNGAITASETVNSLKIIPGAAGQSFNLNGNTLSLTDGGLLFAGTNSYTVGVTTGDTLKSLTSTTTPDLIVQQLGAGTLTINAVIANGGSGASTLTKAGSGTLTLGATNTYTGSTYIDGGILNISANTNLGPAATGAALGLDGGTLEATASFLLSNGAAGTNDRAIALGAGGGTIDVTGSNTLQVNGAIVVQAGNEFGPLIKTDTGTLVLSGAANTYTGATIINGGVLSVGTLANGNTNSSIGNSPGTANALIINGGTLQYTGATVSTNRAFTVGTSGATLDASGSGAETLSSITPVWYTASGSRTLTLTGTNTAANTLAAQITDPAFVNSSLTGSTSLTKSGAGQWLLTNTGNSYTGNTTINAGTLALASASTDNIASSSVITVGTTATAATLDVTGLIGGGLTVPSGQTLAGTGTINNTGAVVISSGGILAPGNSSVATLSLGALTLNNGSITNFAFGASTNSTVASSGLLTLNATDGVNLYQVGTTTKFTTPGMYTLFTYGSLSGTPASAFSVLNPAMGDTYAFSTSGNSVVLTISGAAAVTSVWNVDANGNYSVASNWTNGVPNGISATASFGSVITAPRTVTVDGTFTVGEIDFANVNAYTLTPGTAGNGFIFNNNGIASVISDSSGSHFIAAPIALALGLSVNVTNAANTLTLSGAISNTGAAGTGTLSKTGAGILALLGANTFDGGVTISNGTVQVNSPSSLGATAGTATLDSTSNGVTLEALNSITTSRAFALSGTNNTIQVDGTGTYEIDGVIANGTNPGTLAKTGTGTLALGANNTFMGIVTISAGSLSLGAGGTAGSVVGNITDNAALVLNRTDSYTLGNLISGTGTLTQTGSGNTTLSASNTFTGNTAVAGGTLTLGTALALQDSTLNYNNQGGSLSFGTLTAATLAGLTGAQNLALTNAAATPAGVTLTLGNNNVTSTYTGLLSGSGGLTKTGTGVTTIGSGTSGGGTYSGATTVNQGTLVFGGVSALTGSLSLTSSVGATAVTFQDTAALNSASTLYLSPTSSNGYPTNSTLLLKNSSSITATNVSFGSGGSRVPVGDSITIQDTASLIDNGYLDFSNTVNGTTSAVGTTVALNGGLLAVQKFQATNFGAASTSAGTLRLNGGTLRALASDSSATAFFLPAISKLTVDVDSGGAIIDTNGFNDTIAQTLVHGTGGTTDGGLTKNGAGTLTLTGGNSYYGLTTLNAGTLNINGEFALGGAVYGGLTFNGGTLQYANPLPGTNGTGDITQNSAATPVAKPVTFTSTAVIDVNGNAITYANAVGNGGAGGLTLNSTAAGGSLTLSAANTYTGATTVNNGASLYVNGSVGSNTTPAGAVTVASGATLGGSGTLTVASGSVAGTLAPGAAAGATTGALTLNTTGGLTLTGTLVISLNSTGGVSSGTFLNTNMLTLTGATLLLTGNAADGTTIYDLVNYTGTLGGDGAFANATIPMGYTINYDGTTFAGSDIELDPMSAVPEPATWLAGVLMVGALGYRGRKQIGSLFTA